MIGQASADRQNKGRCRCLANGTADTNCNEQDLGRLLVAMCGVWSPSKTPHGRRLSTRSKITFVIAMAGMDKNMPDSTVILATVRLEDCTFGQQTYYVHGHSLQSMNPQND